MKTKDKEFVFVHIIRSKESSFNNTIWLLDDSDESLINPDEFMRFNEIDDDEISTPKSLSDLKANTSKYFYNITQLLSQLQ